jgi:hypothetical protein
MDALSLGVKRKGREADHTHSSIAEVKNGELRVHGTVTLYLNMYAKNTTSPISTYRLLRNDTLVMSTDFCSKVHQYN